MYFNEGGRAAFLTLWGCRRLGYWHVLLPKKAPDVQTLRPAIEHHRAEVRQKEAKKSSGPSSKKSMAGDVHSGGQDWHPSAGMRYRLRKSEMGISRQWRAAL